MISKILAILFKWLFPPGIEASQEEQYNWRVGVAGVIFLIIGVLVWHLAWISGFPPFEDQAHVDRHTFNEFYTEFDHTRNSVLISSLLDLQEKKCLTSSAELRQVLTQQITTMLVEFEHRTKLNFPLPSCQEITNGNQPP